MEFLDLKAKQFATDTALEPALNMLATKYRTKKAFLNDFTTLHMVVPTIRCNCRCLYCQVSSRADGTVGTADMSADTARKIVRTIMEGSADSIKVEFQGGEPLLRFDLIKLMIDEFAVINCADQKVIQFVVCTNLTLITNDMLHFFRKHGVVISTSLDGERTMHDANRPMRGVGSSHDLLMAKLKCCRQILGEQSVSALLTVTRNNLGQLRKVVDEYVRNGFSSIFIRPLNPFGAAIDNGMLDEYSAEDFVAAYLDVLEYILEINRQGSFFVEEFAALLLQRILTPFPTGFVDLQSPTGATIQCALYNHDGNVYVSDEARMLAETGDMTYRMGNVHKHGFEDLFGSYMVRKLVRESCLEITPICTDCAYLPYCGSDPVRDYVWEKRKNCASGRRRACREKKPIFDHLFRTLIDPRADILDIYWSWITRRTFSNIRLSRTTP